MEHEANANTSAKTTTTATITATKTDITNPNQNAYKTTYNRHRRRPKDPNFIDDLDDLVDFSTVAAGATGAAADTGVSAAAATGAAAGTSHAETRGRRDERIIPLVNRHENDTTTTNNSSSTYKYKYTYKGPIYGIKSHPGFIYVPQALSTHVQHHLAYKSLTEFCNPPHATNIDLVPMKSNEVKNRLLPCGDGDGGRITSDGDGDGTCTQVHEKEESMWDLWKREHGYGHGDSDRRDDDDAANDGSTMADGEGASTSDANEGADHQAKRAKHETKAQAQTNEKTKVKRSAKAKANTKIKYYKSFEKLSWATAGYQYDWTARAYTEEHKSPMPHMLEQLGSIFAQLDESIHNHDQDRDHDHADESDNGHGHNHAHVPPFTSSASIVNYYSLKSNMGGHCDDLELDFTRPVVSISVGLPAVFLLGGRTKNCPRQPVVPILVRPGDVYLLAGESRLCYHGMARVIPKDVALPPVGRCIGGMEVDSFQIQHWRDVLVQNHVKDPTRTCREKENGNEKEEEDFTLPATEEDAVKAFLSTHRINVNVRQVLPPGMLRIPSPDAK